MHDIRILKMAKIISSMDLKVITKFISKYTCTFKTDKKKHTFRRKRQSMVAGSHTAKPPGP